MWFVKFVLEIAMYVGGFAFTVGYTERSGIADDTLLGAILMSVFWPAGWPAYYLWVGIICPLGLNKMFKALWKGVCLSIRAIGRALSWLYRWGEEVGTPRRS